MITCEAVNGWSNTMSKWTVYCCVCPSLSASPQKSPLVSVPVTSLLPTIWALSP